MRWVVPTVYVAALVVAFVALNGRWGQTPPLGPFLNPFAGFWQSNAQVDALPEQLDVPGLQAPVQVAWDTRHVPHIFAENDHDLYLAQGYLTARHRLWQMEFQTHAAAGRISEIVGPGALSYDRSRRRMGMVWAAERSLEAVLADSLTRVAMEAYAEGVNAWVDQLDATTLPLEYKILGYEPEPWTPLKTTLLLKYMAETLSGGSNEPAMTEARSLHGDSLMQALFPYQAPFVDPIIPPGTEWAFEPVPVAPQQALLDPLIGLNGLSGTPADPNIGSNNWAVGGSKAVTGRPILANDPHLTLNLPSIWYEMQLHAPGTNTYGATLPGAPGIIIGFNEHVAWGVTNGGSDVFDWYQITFADAARTTYDYDGATRPVETRIETIQVRGEATVVDTVRYTHHGPVAYLPSETPYGRMPTGAALRWTAHDPTNELRTFLRLNRATDYDDYVEALTTYAAPAQNFVYADQAGTIALWHNGAFPLRWKGQGRYLSDGADPAYEWQGFIPHAHNPHVRDPERGFVSSANQPPTDDTYPYYLGWDYASYERGARLNDRLAVMEAITPRDMMALQLDDRYLHAERALPALLARLPEDGLSADQRTARADLAAWDAHYRAQATAPILFDAWWSTLWRLTWDEFPDGPRPWYDVTLRLVLEEPTSPLFDDQTTNGPETLDDLVQQAFETAFSQLEDRHGPYGEAWAWGQARGTRIDHLAQIPGLGRTDLRTSGRSGTLNAMGRTSGASWRMVVSLEEEVRAWGIYPGGQSGHPGSAFYDLAVDDWMAGTMYPLLFLRAPDQASAEVMARTVLRQTP
ncbi:MAG: penicillin acylase family protein [Bacteroidota bacterium]